MAGARTIGVALLLAALAACGGGGGGGGDGGTNAGGGTGTGGGPDSGGTGGAVTQPNCDAIRDPVAGGFVLGVCSTRQSSVAELNASAFKNLPVAGPQVVTPDFGTRSYTLNLAPPVLGSAATLTPANEDPCRVFIGTRPGYTLQTPSPADLRANPNAPRVAVISFTQRVANCPAAIAPNGQARAELAPAFNTTAKLFDFGTFERYVGGQELYYGGWYFPRQASTFNPAVALRFLGTAAGSDDGVMAAYLFTAISSYGVSGTVTEMVYTPGAGGAPGRLTGTIGNFGYSRANETDPSPQARFEGTLAIEATVQANGAFSGTVSGNGGLGNASASVTGAVEGQILVSGTNAEVAGRIQAQLVVPGGIGVGGRLVGAFATSQ